MNEKVKHVTKIDNLLICTFTSIWKI